MILHHRAPVRSTPVRTGREQWPSSSTGLGLLAVVLVLSCTDDPVTTGPSMEGVATVMVSPAADEIVLGDTLRLVAEALDLNGNPVPGAEVSWSSSAPAVATVDSLGLVRGAGVGNAIITAFSGGVSGQAELLVVVPSPAAVDVIPDTLAFTALGDTLRPVAVVLDRLGRVVKGAAVSWSSSDESVATVDTTGVVSAVGAGRAWVTAAAGTARKAAAVTVTQIAHSVAMSPRSAATSPGDTLRLAATAFDANGHTLAAAIQWSSSHPGVVAVDDGGLAQSGGEGVATITAKAGEVQGTLVIAVGNADRAALVALYHKTNGPGWLYRDNWLSDAPLAEWDGVRVNSDGRVSHLSLSDNGLSGPIPPELVALPQLEGLRLGFNALTGPIPAELGDLGNLVVLNLRGNRLTGPIPAALGGLANLAELRLGANRLTGSIPAELRRLRKLEHLDLGRNRLTGTLPPELSDLAGLTRLYLRSNEFTGPVPAALADLPSLEWLNLAVNHLTGSIPPELGNLSNLELLDLEDNNLTGPIPPQLGRLSRLRGLNLSSNGLTGSVPSELGRLAGLTSLELSFNPLESPLPGSLVAIPGLNNLRFDLSGFDVGTGICAPGTAAFVRWLEDIESAHGRLCNEADEAVLESLFEAAGGEDWIVPDGWLGGHALDQWNGVATDSLGRVVSLDLSRNGLAGRLPASLGRLDHMKTLRVAGNALSGPLPQSFAQLRLQEFHYDGTYLCAPGGSFQTWLTTISQHKGTGARCPALTDREILTVLYDATCGPEWANRDGWLTDAPLGEWHGVGVDEEGRVVALSFIRNDLCGSIPPEVGGLTHLQSLLLFSTGLSGSIPPALGHLSGLKVLNLAGNDLTGTIPPGIARPRGLESLDLWSNELSGAIPPQLGVLANLENLNLGGNQLAGRIPAQLGNLANLRILRLWGNRLTGPIPPELGNLARLETLSLHSNEIDGSIPPEIGGMAALGELQLYRNRLSGAITPTLATLSQLAELALHANELTGSIPPEIGGMDGLRVMDLSENQLSGPVPAAVDGLDGLRTLNLTNNTGLAGALPESMASLDRLGTLMAEGTGLCAPPTPAFRQWLSGVHSQRVPVCLKDDESVTAHLVQTVQSLAFPVPLVANKPAQLRVFLKASRPTSERIPAVRATFFLKGAETHVAEIPAESRFLPTEIDEDDLALWASAEIPAGIIRPGLELVVEVGEGEPLAEGLGIARRHPESGRLALDVRQLPELDLNLIPFLLGEAADSTIVRLAADMAKDPEGHELLWDTRTLLPVGDLNVSAHQPVVSSSNDTYDLFDQTVAIQRIEGGTGFWMGMTSPGVRTTGPLGLAYLNDQVSFSRPDPSVMAHELGHNLSLLHAPCGTGRSLDPYYPYEAGSIGAWGYDFSDDGGLVPPSTPDLMSYCDPAWISDYHFSRALRYRSGPVLADGDPAAATTRHPAPSVMVWGGVDENGVPFLNPAFAVDAPPALPEPGGEFGLVGLTSNGATLFALRFDLPVIADSDGRSSFAFVLPVKAADARALASITFTGPGGIATLDRHTDRPMVILRETGGGQVRAFLRDPPFGAAGHVSADPGARTRHSGLTLLFSRGLPDRHTWQR
ncbi:MAG: hypothetical protein F4Z50_05195 [Gemmatimonadetes bacterium]|nr:hypothetical protein [Gemmatimonadota bacterium]MYD13218.1 hypothetical protein [Gemmatimonadota bacterium]